MWALTSVAQRGDVRAQPSAPVLSRSDESGVRARALEWWQARERRDHQRMYALFEPAYRKQVSFADFLTESVIRSRFDLAKPIVESVAIESSGRVRVRTRIQTHPPGLPAGQVTAEDMWVKVSGQWFKLHEKDQSPFTTPR
ncbi:MAG: hypothetical protein ABIZ92_11385 [Vicinamibacterales bacterium]